MVVTLVSEVPTGMVSVMSDEPAATVRGVLQEPPGAAPAGTVSVPDTPVTLKLKSVPTVTPPPATLQTCTKPDMVVDVAHEPTETVLVSIVTAAVRAITLPITVALVFKVTLVFAKMFPMN
jgi:hypothetical protein